MKYTDIFERNKKNGKIKIQVALDVYDDYYHEWDNARYRKRDINPDLYNFIEECFEQIPLKEKIELEFDIAEDTPDSEREKTIKESYSNYFNSELLAQGEGLKSTWFTIAKSIIVAIVLLWGSSVASPLLPENTFTGILIEGMLIGGWVFAWEAIYISAFSLREEKREYKKLMRMKNATVVFTYQCS